MNEINFQDFIHRVDQTRKAHWPPDFAINFLEDLPVYQAPNAETLDYLNAHWKELQDEAKQTLSSCLDDEDISSVEIPNHLNFPLIYTNVSRVIINKTKAKESKTFRGVADLTEKCGSFELEEIEKMSDWLHSDDTACLIAHREYVDLRAYIFQEIFNEYKRVRFYSNGLLLGVKPEFTFTDSRGKDRKQRSDSYKDPIASNEIWKVFAKYR